MSTEHEAPPWVIGPIERAIRIANTYQPTDERLVLIRAQDRALAEAVEQVRHEVKL